MNEKINGFLEQVCSQVKYPPLHRPLKGELYSHVQERLEGELQAGATEEEAIQRALEAMGNPEEIGRELHKIHKPRTEWGVCFLLLLLVGAGALILFSIGSNPAFHMSLYPMAARYLVYSVLGIGVCVACYFMNYDRVELYEKWIYVAAMGLLVMGQFFAPLRVNGRSYFGIGGLYFTPASISIPLLLLSYGSFLRRWGKEGGEKLAGLVGLAVLPLLFILSQSSLVYVILAGCGLLWMLVRTILGPDFKGSRLKWMSGLCGGLLVSAVGYFYVNTYQFRRLSAFLNPSADPLGEGYLYITIRKVLQQAHWVGTSEGLYMTLGESVQGFAVPEINTDQVFVYVVGQFGWLAGLLLAGLVLAVIFRLAYSTRQIGKAAGRQEAEAIVMVFALQAVGNVFMNLGLFPLTAFSLPFVSYGGTNFMMNMMLLGLWLGIYRRKNFHSLLHQPGPPEIDLDIGQMN